MSSSFAPYSEESEKGVLGCILLDSQATMDTVVESLPGGPEAFFDRRHRLIFEAARDIWEKSMAVDTISVISQLRATGLLEDVGGPTYVSELEAGVPSIANLDTYINSINEHHSRREVIRVSSKAIEQARDGKEPITAVFATVESLVSNQDPRVRRRDRTVKEVTKDVLSALQDRTKGNEPGVYTGIAKIDRKTGGFKPGEFAIIAGRPSQGKTVLAMQMATYASMAQQKRVGVFSLEMSADKLIERVISANARLNMRDSRQWSNDDYKRLTTVAIEVSKMPMRIDDRYGLTIGDIRSKAKRWSREGGLDLLVLDYLQLVKPRGKLSEVRHAIEEISRELKGLAGELKVPIIVACQLNRELEKEPDRKPRMSDIREAGGIEQDADFIGALYRPDPDQDPSHPMPSVNLWVMKYRNGEAQYDVRFRFIKREVRFDEISEVETGE
jgi:replicative DNA helicase